MTDEPAVPLSQVIGENCRRIRLREGRTQGDVAAACQRVGLGWGYRRVAQLEAGGVAASLPTLLRLAAALDSLGVEPVTVADLLWSDALVRLSDDAAEDEALPGQLLPHMLTVWRGRELLPHLRPFTAGEEDDDADGPLRVRSDYGRADERAAKSLGLRRAEMIELTHSLWGHGLETERERRAAESGIGENRAARSWITTSLRDALEAELERRRQSPEPVQHAGPPRPLPDRTADSAGDIGATTGA
jgi:transcriptional regulator with XRE-family HTH domain